MKKDEKPKDSVVDNKPPRRHTRMRQGAVHFSSQTAASFMSNGNSSLDERVSFPPRRLSLNELMSFPASPPSPRSPVVKPSYSMDNTVVLRTNRTRKSSTQILVDPQVKLYFSIRKLNLSNVRTVLTRIKEAKSDEALEGDVVNVQMCVLQRFGSSWVLIGTSETKQISLQQSDTVGSELNTMDDVTLVDDSKGLSIREQEEHSVNVRYDFKFNVTIQFHFESLTSLMFVLVVADEQKFVLGKCESMLGNIVGQKDLTAKLLLKRDQLLTATFIAVGQKVNPEQQKELRLSMAPRASDLDVYLDLTIKVKHIHNSKYSDTYVEVSQLFKQEGKEQVVDEDLCLALLNDDNCTFIPLYTTETHSARTNAPSFRPFSIKPQVGEARIVLRFDVYRYAVSSEESVTGSHGVLVKTLIGSHIVALDQLLTYKTKQEMRLDLEAVKLVQLEEDQDEGRHQNLVRVKSKKFVHKSIPTGSISIKHALLRKVPIVSDVSRLLNSFLDYMTTGLRFKVVFGVDLSSDNKFPRNDPCLHYNPDATDEPSIYEHCMEIIGERINQYAPDNTDFHLIGFGHSDYLSSQNMKDLDEDSEIERTSQMLPSPVALTTNLLKEDESDDGPMFENWLEVIQKMYSDPIGLSQCSKVYRDACTTLRNLTDFSLSMRSIARHPRYSNADYYSHHGSRQIIEDESDERKDKDMTAKAFAPNDFHHLITDMLELYTNNPSQEVKKEVKPKKHRLLSTAILRRNRSKEVIEQKEQKKEEEKPPITTDKSGLPATLLYNILVILVSNDHIDVSETILKLVEASHKAPISVIILGLGSGSSFKTLRSINMDAKRVKDSKIQYRLTDPLPQTNLQFKGLRAARSVCTFVRVNDFPSLDAACEAAIKNLPQQVCRYFRAQHL